MEALLGGADLTRADVLVATAHVATAVEILGTRIGRKDPDIATVRTDFDTISDSSTNAGIVLGPERHAADSFDLRPVGAITSRDSVVEETGLGAGVLNDPVESMICLARCMARYGQSIEAGQMVLSGSFIRPVECPPGSRVQADVGEFGAVDISFG